MLTFWGTFVLWETLDSLVSNRYIIDLLVSCVQSSELTNNIASKKQTSSLYIVYTNPHISEVIKSRAILSKKCLMYIQCIYKMSWNME